MTTNANLLPGMLIEYKSASGPATAWVLEQLGRGPTDATIAIRVKGEGPDDHPNRDLEFTIYVRPKGRAKILEGDIPVEKPVHDAPSDGQIKTPRAAGSHAQCTHESSKAARAKCRKDRAIALAAGDAGNA